MESETEIFSKSVKAICPDLTDAELSQFASKLNFKELDKKDLFLKTGKVQKAIGLTAPRPVQSHLALPPLQLPGHRTTITHAHSPKTSPPLVF
jgi:hypothetical protein